jgi:CDP-6-deoxy-D-xylo-4-hexulose-3-dehydrase
MQKFNHALMQNNFIKKDIDEVINFLRTNDIFTQNKKVKQFEKNWSKWLGVKYSVFVNSGSSANFITLAIIKKIYGTGEVILPAFTWISDVIAVTEHGFKPVFVDINFNNLSANEEEIYKKVSKKTKAVFITHAQGFNGLSNKLITFLKKRKIILLEDVCESHGACFNKKKLGTYGLISNFSFYYAHHMSTIEGGMICTNNRKIYELGRMFRSHGMLREVDDRRYEKKIQNRNRDLSSKFIFMLPGYNFRNNEIGAVLGISQLKRLNQNNRVRSRNLEFFLKNLNDIKFYTDFKLTGNSNYALPVILKSKNFVQRNRLEKLMTKNKIEFRRGSVGGGNQLRQPYLKNMFKKNYFKEFSVVEHIHFFGYYIGNFPTLNKSKIKMICKILNSL